MLFIIIVSQQAQGRYSPVWKIYPGSSQTVGGDLSRVTEAFLQIEIYHIEMDEVL